MWIPNFSPTDSDLEGKHYGVKVKVRVGIKDLVILV